MVKDEKDNYYSQENRRLERKVKELEEREKYLDKKVKDHESSEQYDIKKRWKEKNCILIGGYSGISIPLDDVMKEEINEYIYKEVRKFFESNEDIQEQFIKVGLSYKKPFISIFKPIVKEIIDNLDFNIKLQSEDYD